MKGEKPRRFERLCYRALVEGAVSDAKAAELLGISVHDCDWSETPHSSDWETTMTEPNTPFAPDWASQPGDTIADLIEERGWTQAELAERLGYSARHVNRLVQGKVALTEDAALRLEPVLGASAGFWLTREARYRERAARLKAAGFHAEWVR